MPAVASSAPAVLIAHLAGTRRPPCESAREVSCCPTTLHSWWPNNSRRWRPCTPGRIDLGLGHAPGTDQLTVRALRRTPEMHADTFPDDVVELINYLLPGDGPPDRPFANPGRGYLPEVWLLGSSLLRPRNWLGYWGSPYFRLPLCSAAPGRCAYHLPVELPPFGASFRTQGSGSHFGVVRTDRVRSSLAFRLHCPEHSPAANRSLGPTPESRRRRSAIRSPKFERSIVEEAMSTRVIGNPESVAEGLRRLEARTGADEIMLSTRSHSYETRLRSLSLIASNWGMVTTA